MTGFSGCGSEYSYRHTLCEHYNEFNYAGIDINISVNIKCFQSKSLVIADHLSCITVFSPRLF